MGQGSRRVNVRVEKNTDGQVATGQMAKGQDDQRKPCSAVGDGSWKRRRERSIGLGWTVMKAAGLQL